MSARRKAAAAKRPKVDSPQAPAAAPPRPQAKRGFLSAQEKAFIERNRRSMTAEFMAAQLGRAAGQVEKFLAKTAGDSPEPALKVSPTLVQDLERRPEWVQFEAQFDAPELEYFKYRYVQLMNQFGKDDVLPTEEMQVFQLITMELMATQAMRERKTLVRQQAFIQHDLDGLYNRNADLTSQEKALCRDLEGRFKEISDQLKVINVRHESYTMRTNKILEQLKGTRDQRVKVIEGSRQSFLGYLKALTQEDFRDSQGRDAELVRLAMEKERGRLATPHVYVDGEVDTPLLVPDPVVPAYTLSSIDGDETLENKGPEGPDQDPPTS